MDNSNSESDVSLSPSQIMERLQMLRQLQLLQRGKLQKQRLEYQENTESSISITEIVSQFSDSTSYNTFRSLLDPPSNNVTPRINSSDTSHKVAEKDMIEGISVLNLSQESEYIINTPTSTQNSFSPSKNQGNNPVSSENSFAKLKAKKQISLDDMPILSPKKDFEALILEKLQGELSKKLIKSPKNVLPNVQKKKQFLRRGEGTSRFGLQKKDFVIQNTKSLPWRRKSLHCETPHSPEIKKLKSLSKSKKRAEKDIEIKPKDSKGNNKTNGQSMEENLNKSGNTKQFTPREDVNKSESMQSSLSDSKKQVVQDSLVLPKNKPTSTSLKGKTWAKVFSKEQNDFLQQLKQSDYYKNFVSPSKSIVSNASCDTTLLKQQQEKEVAEQNMFNLLENKVTHESFSLENSFISRFLRHKQLECSGESTPQVLQQCLAKNPKLMHIFPNISDGKASDCQSDEETCNSECTDCCGRSYMSVYSCCSCKSGDETNNKENGNKNSKEEIQPPKKQASNKDNKVQKGKISQTKKVDEMADDDNGNDIADNDNSMKANMVEMNAKLIATSELLKDRLRELEDEIETFRQENASLAKLREEIDAERRKFYEEKAMFEQKYNEEKILSEYYIAEERDKLTKQKQLYEKYVREMRGRLSKKDKEEVVNLKKEIHDLKEEIRLKDAKSTSTIARLRNQMKIMEKDKKDLENEVEKLKKENRRIQHSNDMTRRMTNIKYLEEINKKLTNITAKETQSETNIVNNAKYRAFEIERQSRPRKIQTAENKPMVRARSVPNLKVTSRYAKYFSQRDAISDMERNEAVDVEPLTSNQFDNDDSDSEIITAANHNDSESEDENNLEKLYMERFHLSSPESIKSNKRDSSTNINTENLQTRNGYLNYEKFFMLRPNSSYESQANQNLTVNSSPESISQGSKSPVSVLSNRPSDQRSRHYGEDVCNNIEQISTASYNSSKSNVSKSPISILTNRSSSQKQTTVIHKDFSSDKLNLSPEPKPNRAKTNLNPTEIKKPDGSRELRFPNGNVKFLSSDGNYSKFVYYNGDVKENFYDEGRIKYFYAETKTYHTTHADGLEVLEFPDGQVEKRYKDSSTEIRLPNGSIRYFDPKNKHVREEWRFPDGTALTVSATGEQRIVFSNGQIEVHTKDHKRREFPDGTVKLVYNDGTTETRYASGRVRIKDKHGNLIMDSSTR